MISAMITMISLNAHSVPLRFEEGKHYQVISKTASSEPKLTEYFSFYCGACFKFEPLVNSLKTKLPEDAKFVKSHVDFIRAASPEIQAGLAKAFVVAERMGNKQAVIDAIFKQIHIDRKPFESDQDIIALAASVGIDKAKFTKMYNNQGAKREAKKMKTMQNQLTQQGILQGVPMFIVNDKYKINNRELRSEQEYQDLIAFLLSMK